MFELNCDTLVWLCENLDRAEKLLELTLGNMSIEGHSFDDKDRAKLLAKCFILIEQKKEDNNHDDKI